MTPVSNRQVRLKSRPTGIPQATHFEIVEAALPQLADKEFLVRNEYLSVEPAMRGWVSAVPNYSTPVAVGEVMRAFAAVPSLPPATRAMPKERRSWECWAGRNMRSPTAARSRAK